MPVRKADARWDGTLEEGTGRMRMATGAYEGPFSFGSRFEEEQGTNPEELIASAHAGCFSMQLAGNIGAAGHEPESIETTAAVHIDKAGEGFKITRIELDTQARVPGIDEEEFQRHVDDAKTGCPVSVALAAVDEITVNAQLVS